MEDTVRENLISVHNDSSSSDANEGEQKHCRTQQSPSSRISVITCDRDCEMMHVLSDNSNKTEASENSPTTILGDENDSTSSNESDCHDLFFNLPCSLINSTSESENDKNMSDIDVQPAKQRFHFIKKIEFTALQTLARYF